MDNRRIEANQEQIGQYFQRWEFACQGGSCCGHSASVDPVLVVRADKLRDMIGSINPSSGFRCYRHNNKPVKQGGAGSDYSSQHPRGRAMDIPHEGRDVDEMAEAARVCGFAGIGRYTWGIHVDVRPNGGDFIQWDER